MDFEEIPYEVWLRDKLSSEKKHMENGFRSAAYDPLRMARSTRVLRRVSQVCFSSCRDSLVCAQAESCEVFIFDTVKVNVIQSTTPQGCEYRSRCFVDEVTGV